MKKAIVLLLTGAMALSLAACGGQARTIPGTYKSAGFIQTADYVLNEDDTYIHGEEKGTYAAGDGDVLSLTPQGSEEAITLSPSGAYYYDSRYAMTEDTEFGAAPPFENGVSGQTFSIDVSGVTATLALSEDGTFQFTVSSPAPEYTIMDNTVTYEGTYALDKEVLTLTWNDMAFPCLFVDDALYAVVYEQENDENSDAIAQRQAAVSEAEQAAKDAAWWTAAEDGRAAEIMAAAQGTWTYTESGAYGLTYQYQFVNDYVYVTVSMLGYPAQNQGEFTVCNDVLLVKYDGGTQGSVAIPYVYEDDGTLKLYPINALNDDAVKDPGMEFVTAEQAASGPWAAKAG